jgi:hypothetical protein
MRDDRGLIEISPVTQLELSASELRRDPALTRDREHRPDQARFATGEPEIASVRNTRAA